MQTADLEFQKNFEWGIYMTSRQNILDRLNEEQKLAVLDYYGPQFLVAGPGSGKTFTLVSRTQYMILDGINPSNILLFTFTNKAAKEIKERISRAVGEDTAKMITSGTYHSFCCRLLRQYGENLGYKKGFSIFDSDDSKKLVKKITKGSDVDYNALIAYMSKQKRNLISPQKALEDAHQNEDDFAKYYSEYQKSLFQQNSMDFDDLIYNTIRLLKRFPDVLAKVNSKYKYITADESHDSSNCDIELIRLLAGPEDKGQNVCFILDDNQSIYGFRGADIAAVLGISRIFPNLKYYYLNQNYRSSKTIVEASKSMIANNSNQIEKNIFTSNEVGDKIIVFEEGNPQYEAIRIVKMIQTLHQKYNYNYKDIAILYRTSNQSRVIEEIFLKYKIPYEILSGINFYSRKEIKDIVAFIRFLVNPWDQEAFKRIVNIPKRGIGDKTIEKILDEANNHMPPVDCYTACRNLLEKNEIKGKAKGGISQFLETIKTLGETMDDKTVPDLVSDIIKFSNYYEYLKDEAGDDYDDKVVNLLELVELSYSFNTLEEFLEQTSLDRKEDEDESDNVQLLTMHMSKGLEWDAVFCIGCNEGTNPHFRSLGSTLAIEEERRLFYVAMTRAKKHLFLTRSKKIQQNGFFIDAKPSRFISEINKKYLYIPGNK